MAVVSEKTAGGRNVLAFLDMLAWSEGTSTIRGSDNGYNVVVGGGLFNGYADHPRLKVYLPRYKVYSTAAGRYQLLSRYWDAYRESLALKGGFTPANQDLVALQQIKER
ncbi:TPA: glycoside hydrolase family 104 protein, partial [Pseudomonas aeruginosa]|nr:glycoside hydrolase family 104 protein [Pseudomonas aeruginosa]